MKIIILIFTFIYTYNLTCQNIEIKYLNQTKKYSTDNGKTWDFDKSKITIKYIDLEKVSYDNGNTWQIININKNKIESVLLKSTTLNLEIISESDDYKNYILTDINGVVIKEEKLNTNNIDFRNIKTKILFLYLINEKKSKIIKILN